MTKKLINQMLEKLFLCLFFFNFMSFKIYSCYGSFNFFEIIFPLLLFNKKCLF